MIETLDQLAQYVRQTVPQPKAILNLNMKEQLDAVTFVWHAREFMVKKALEVLELKGQNLYVTGATRLMQSALMTTGRSEIVLEGVLDSIRQAENLIEDDQQKESGLKLLETIKSTLRKLVGP